MGKSKGSTDKRHAQRSVEATARNKQLFVEALAKGAAPGNAAQKVKIARSTAYAWRREDPAFAKEWDNAVQTALDVLETTLYDRAMKGNSARCVADLALSQT